MSEKDMVVRCYRLIVEKIAAEPALKRFIYRHSSMIMGWVDNEFMNDIMMIIFRAVAIKRAWFQFGPIILVSHLRFAASHFR